MYPKPRPWMSVVLWGAALYNLSWGSWVVLFPHSGFLLAHMAVPNYPELWQCIGMIVGVYGVGYAVAASDPIRHWPIVLVGLLGKVFGPIGFVQSAWHGHLPWVAGLTILTNDVIWWIPFGLILRAAWNQHLSALRHYSPDILNLALRTRTSSGDSIEQMSTAAPVLVVFLRHAGCTFCREALADLARQRPLIEAAGAKILLVHMGEVEFSREFFLRYGLADLPSISDPHRHVYRAFGLRRGDLRMLFGPKVWWRGFRAGVIEGHGIGRLIGDGFQMPGIFLVFHGQILRCYRHQSAADRPDYVRFVAPESHQPVA